MGNWICIGALGSLRRPTSGCFLMREKFGGSLTIEHWSPVMIACCCRVHPICTGGDSGLVMHHAGEFSRSSRRKRRRSYSASSRRYLWGCTADAWLFAGGSLKCPPSDQTSSASSDELFRESVGGHTQHLRACWTSRLESVSPLVTRIFRPAHRSSLLLQYIYRPSIDSVPCFTSRPPL
jgi:hypothetical protein